MYLDPVHLFVRGLFISLFKLILEMVGIHANAQTIIYEYSFTIRLK